ncbi:hypothetical protein BD410DRAFT_834444 [Rickenella mellea]|uniref:HAM1-like N-terminal domain-containing protein n=1 Tax=Rickenella mellea TaxID=50990 RepID=A0A4Y7QLP4_9AGAM|nr:hypothetical protein BD410DRAFT_834444 [Rickenella mellea]
MHDPSEYSGDDASDYDSNDSEYDTTDSEDDEDQSAPPSNTEAPPRCRTRNLSQTNIEQGRATGGLARDIEEVLKLMGRLGLNLTLFLDAICWGDVSCKQSEKIKFERADVRDVAFYFRKTTGIPMIKHSGLPDVVVDDEGLFGMLLFMFIIDVMWYFQ